MYIVIKDFHFK